MWDLKKNISQVLKYMHYRLPVLIINVLEHYSKIRQFGFLKF